MEKDIYFISSDIHSFYDEYQFSLSQQGFDINNPKHKIIICGDIFDRGSQSKELFDFLKSLPEDRRFLIKGNHEDLIEEIFEKGYVENYDFRNGTVKTICDLCDKDMEFVMNNLEACQAILENKGFFDFIKSMKNYAEIGEYIFVHGWIPTDHYLNENLQMVNKFRKDWRNATDDEWCEARWTNGMQAYYNNCGETNKTIVCGHWHSSYGHVREKYKKLSNREYYKLEFADDASFDIFKKTKYKKSILAMDACTAYTHKVNVLKLIIDE